MNLKKKNRTTEDRELKKKLRTTEDRELKKNRNYIGTRFKKNTLRY